jgi:hypothetical protein
LLEARGSAQKSPAAMRSQFLQLLLSFSVSTLGCGAQQDFCLFAIPRNPFSLHVKLRKINFGRGIT